MRKNILRSNTDGIIIVVSAPSGAGKTTLCKKLLAESPNLRFSVSYTTRTARQGEVDGVDYRFISEAEFKKRREMDEFVEWEKIYGNLYGTSRIDIENLTRQGYDVVLDIDTRGARNVKSLFPEAILIFVMPPSVKTLKDRLKKRGSEPDNIIQVRFERAMEEIGENEWYDYLVFNDIIKNSLSSIRAVYVAEKSRRSRLQGRIDDFYRTTGGK